VAEERKLEDKDFWDPPALWSGETTYIIGGGPSLKGFDWSHLHDKHVVGCNDAYLLGDWVDVCVFGDRDWFMLHWKDEVKVNGTAQEGLPKFAGLRVTNLESCARIPGLLVCRRRGLGINMRPRQLSWNLNTGGLAINLAARLGASVIVLLGFDMKLEEGGKKETCAMCKGSGRWRTQECPACEGDGIVGESNFHPNRTPPGKNVYHKFMGTMPKVKEDADRLGITVLNANPDSAMDTFPRVKASSVL